MLGWWNNRSQKHRKSSANAKGKKAARRGRAIPRRLLVESLEDRSLLSGTPVLGMLSDVLVGAVGSSPSEFVEMGSMTYFVANTTRLWKTDGTRAGTEMVRNLSLDGANEIGFFYNFNGTLAFGINTGGTTPATSQLQLWKSNGTSGGTSRVKDFGLGSYVDPDRGPQFTTLNGRLFGVVYTASHGGELWSSDLASSTYEVKDIYSNPATKSSNPQYLTVFNNRLYFAATSYTSNAYYNNERELWWTDGTQGNATEIDIKSGTWKYHNPDPAITINIPASSYPQRLTVFNNTLFFGATDPGSDGFIDQSTTDDRVQLYAVNTSNVATQVYDFGDGSGSPAADPQLTVAGSYLYGVVNNGRTGDVVTGAVTSGQELWGYDGTSTVPLEINTQAGGSAYPDLLTNVNGTLFFAANDGTTGAELWKSGGTAGTTVQVKDINPGAGSAFDYTTYANEMVNVNNTPYFTAFDGTHGLEVWRSDGTLAGTVLAKDIKSGADSSNPAELSYSGGTLYLSADDGSHGAEPWILAPQAIASVVGRTDSGDWWVGKSTGTGFVNEFWGSWAPGAGWQDVHSADVNGDGREDLIGRTGGGQWWVARSTGTAFANEYWGSWAAITWNDVQIGDVNGDGRDDIVARTSGGDWWVARSTGTGFVNEYWGSWAPGAGWQDVHAVDVNFDGRSDLVGRTSGGDWWVAKSSGTSFVNEYWGSWAAITWNNIQFADMNGDGRTDVVGRTDGGDWWVAKSTGTGFVNEWWGSWAPGAGWQDVHAADVNGDGRADIVGRTDGGDWWVAKSTGTSVVNEYWGSWVAIAWQAVAAADVDGDGKSDFLGRTDTGQWWVAKSTGTSFVNEYWGSWGAITWNDVLAGPFA